MVVVMGRKRPVASANPVTVPEASPGRASLTIAHTPEVPIETETSPGPSDRPSAAPMLSPVPAAIAAPEAVRAMTSFGASGRRGSSRFFPSAASTSSGFHASSRVE